MDKKHLTMLAAALIVAGFGGAFILLAHGNGGSMFGDRGVHGGRDYDDNYDNKKSKPPRPTEPVVVDQCPVLDGNAARTGCPFATRVFINERMIDKRIGENDRNIDARHEDDDKNPHRKRPFDGGVIKVFDAKLITAKYGRNPKKSSYQAIYNDASILPSGTCVTGSEGNQAGECFAGLPAAGYYLKIARVVSADGAIMYLGHADNDGNKGKGDRWERGDWERYASSTFLKFYTIYAKDGTITHRPEPVVEAPPVDEPPVEPPQID